MQARKARVGFCSSLNDVNPTWRERSPVAANNQRQTMHLGATKRVNSPRGKIPLDVTI